MAKNSIPLLNKLTDAQEMQRQHPATFSAPSESELALVTRGDWVKICREGERFWVKVVAGIGKSLIGDVDSMLVNEGNADLAHGTRVRFEYRHIYQIMHPPSGA